MLSKTNFKYIGAIRTPDEIISNVTFNPGAYPPEGGVSDGFNNGGTPFAIDHKRKEFVMGSRHGRVARVKIVEPFLAPPGNTDAHVYPIAPYADTPQWLDCANGDWSINDSGTNGGINLGGLLPIGDGLIVAATTYYDANNSQRRSFFKCEWPVLEVRPLARTPWRAVGDPNAQGYVAGPLAPVPNRHRAALGGDVISGQAGLPIVSRLSAGPCAISWTADKLVTDAAIPSKMLVGYPLGEGGLPGHPWSGTAASDIYSQATMIRGMAIVGDDIIFVGNHGYGVPQYGKGTNDPSLVGTIDPSDGGEWAYDPLNSAKGCHAYPYRGQVWHYPLADLVAVANGTKRYNELIPSWFGLDDILPWYPNQHYGVNDDPLGSGIRPKVSAGLDACAYDYETRRLYVVSVGQTGYGWEPSPLIHVFEITSAPVEGNPTYDGSTPLPPVVVTPPPPPPPPPVVVDPPPPPPPPPVDPCAAVKAEVAALKLEIDNVTVQLHTATTEISTSKAAVKVLYDRAVKVKSTPKWLLDGLRALLAK